MANIPSVADMLKAGAHFGHQRSRWHPKMKDFIFGLRNSVHIIDLDKTQAELAKAADYVKALASQGKVILFVGTKRQARDIVKSAAENCGAPYLVERWIGGLITNFDEFKKRMRKYLQIQDMFATGEIEKYTKKEQVNFKKQVEKMDKYLKGLVKLEKVPDALYIADLRVEKTAVAEARRMDVAMVAVCDTNVDPTKVAYPIPANDDAVNSIKLIAGVIAEAVKEGKEICEKNKAEVKPITAVKKVFSESEEAEPVKPESKNTSADKAKKSAPRRALRKEESV